MSRSLQEQLSEALAKAQEKVGKDRPEHAALQVLKESLVDILSRDNAKAPAPSINAVVPKAPSAIPAGYRLISAAATPFSLFLEKGKVGDQYLSPKRLANPFATASSHGKKLRINQGLLITGGIGNPEVQNVQLVTIIDPNAESTSDAGNSDDGNSGGSESGV